MTATLRAIWEDRIGTAVMRQLTNATDKPVDFRNPAGEPALYAPDSLTWRVMKNPVALFTGGVSAVILELAEPRVRAGVWDHTTFRTNPVARMKRTGMAALVTTYAARSVAERMIAGVRRMHGRVTGTTSGGQAYAANDPDLLDWVQTTANYGFVSGYDAYVAPLSDEDRTALASESVEASKLYGVVSPPRSHADILARFDAMLPSLERTPVVFEFLDIVQRAPILPPPLRVVQHTLIRASVELVPPHIRSLLDLGDRWRLRSWERRLVKLAGAASERIAPPGSPPVEACRRLGLDGKWLYSRQRRARPI